METKVTKMLSDYEFEFVTEIQPECDEEGNVKAEHYALKSGDVFNKFGDNKFCKLHLNIPEGKCGLYALCADGVPVYIGQTKDLKERWSSTGYGSISYKNALKSGQTTNCMVNAYICEAANRGIKLELYFCEMQLAEQKLIVAFEKLLNKHYNK